MNEPIPFQRKQPDPLFIDQPCDDDSIRACKAILRGEKGPVVTANAGVILACLSDAIKDRSNFTTQLQTSTDFLSELLTWVGDLIVREAKAMGKAPEELHQKYDDIAGHIKDNQRILLSD